MSSPSTPTEDQTDTNKAYSKPSEGFQDLSSVYSPTNATSSDTETTVSNSHYNPAYIDEPSQTTTDSGANLTNVVKTEPTPSSHHPVTTSPPSIKLDPSSVAQFGVLNLFINHIPLDMNDAELLSLFSPFGDIDSAKVMVDLQTGQSKGYGFVKFRDPSSAKSALQYMNGKAIREKVISVKPAESPGANPTTPFVTNSGLPFGDALTEEYVKTLFTDYGAIDSVRIVLDVNTNMPRGQAFVRYVDQKSAEAALNAMNGYVIPNSGSTKGLNVRYADTAQEKKQKGKIKQNKRGGPQQQQQSGHHHHHHQQQQQRYTPYQSHGNQQQQQQYNNRMNTNVVQNTSAAPAYGGYYQDPYGQTQYAYGEQPTTLFVARLPPDADDATLYRLFGPYGPILNVKVIRDPKTGQSKGYGFVTYGNYQCAYNSVTALSNYQIAPNRYLSVEFKKYA